jgi:SAM-dependent methyltransferase
MTTEASLKDRVYDFWNDKSCGEVYAQTGSLAQFYESHSRSRYELEPYIHDFARFGEGSGKDVLEIGVGMGADHLEWAKSNPRSLTGVDLTPRAIEHTRERMRVYGYTSHLQVGDAENLSFADESFDLVYSWGVLHHSPDTSRAISEVYRVLRKGGTARIMMYYRYSIVGYMLWLRYALLAGKPFRSLEDIYAHHLESPGTKAYTCAQARKMLDRFATQNLKIQLSPGDLLEGAVGQRHQGVLLKTAKAIWPRSLLKRIGKNYGTYLLIEAVK